MPSDLTLSGSIGWLFWFTGEVAFKWVPGFVVSLTGAQSSTAVTPVSQPPLILNAVSVQDVVQFLQTNTAPGVYDRLYDFWTIFVGSSIALSLILATILIYCLIRVYQIRRAEYAHFEAAAHTVAASDVPKTRLRWNRIQEQAYSENEQQWRLAILEADIMLNELLDSLGYRGETMSDKMRSVDRGQFDAIDIAWEAHRFRNRIAHESMPSLTGAEVRRIISLYEKVFREFDFVE